MLEKLHAIGFVHGDVKPENFCVGVAKAKTNMAAKLFMIDFGITTRYRHEASGAHLPPTQSEVLDDTGCSKGASGAPLLVGYYLLVYVYGTLVFASMADTGGQWRALID